MIATQYLNQNTPVKHNRANVTIMKRMSYNLIQTPKFNKTHGLNFQLITFISRDIADSLQHLFDEKLITARHIDFFTKKVNKDVDEMEVNYSKSGGKENFSNNFSIIQDFFNALTNKSTSEFQRLEDPMLVHLLNCIYQIKFVMNNIAMVAWSEGRLPNKTIVDLLEFKLNELETVFLKRYSNVSNKKSFDFNKFQYLFDKIKKMDYEEFNELTKNF